MRKQSRSNLRLDPKDSCFSGHQVSEDTVASLGGYAGNMSLEPTGHTEDGGIALGPDGQHGQIGGQEPGSPNAHSVEIRVASTDDTEGGVNLHPSWVKAGGGGENKHFVVGVSEDRNRKCRRTMEDAHAFVYDFGGEPGAGYFAIFDGHAGKHAAEYCGEHFHEHLKRELKSNPKRPVPDTLNTTFLSIDRTLSEMSNEGTTHSGCTAVIAYLRNEERSGRSQRVLYTANVGDARAVLNRSGRAVRLSYDHKGSDPVESKRITDAGGFVMNNRVNGVLAVTRSLGDTAMKEFVVGSPYTTETVLGEGDDVLILACDGVSWVGAG